MQNPWYGDKRDLVKWGVLLALADRHRLKHILQILFKREDTWPTLDIDGDPVELPSAVVKHFRDATSVALMQCSARIEVFAQPFANRNDYLQELLGQIRSRPERPGIVFLDPDIGLEPPSRRGTEKHVLELELKQIWDTLSFDDMLVLYQHQTNRDGTNWVDPKRLQFEKALLVYIEKKGKKA